MIRAIVTDIEVTLPVKARKHYKDMEKEMFTSLDSGHEVEAFNAAAKTDGGRLNLRVHLQID